jgi:hypothetical protein
VTSTDHFPAFGQPGEWAEVRAGFFGARTSKRIAQVLDFLPQLRNLVLEHLQPPLDLIVGRRWSGEWLADRLGRVPKTLIRRGDLRKHEAVDLRASSSDLSIVS